MQSESKYLTIIFFVSTPIIISLLSLLEQAGVFHYCLLRTKISFSFSDKLSICPFLRCLHATQRYGLMFTRYFSVYGFTSTSLLYSMYLSSKVPPIFFKQQPLVCGYLHDFFFDIACKIFHTPSDVTIQPSIPFIPNIFS